MSRQDKIVSVLAFVVVLAALVLPLLAADGAAPAAQDMTITGEVVDLSCYMESGARGADHKACAVACMEAGNAVGIVDANGSVYLAMGTEKKPAKDVLKGRMAATVTVTGKLIKKGGLQAIYITSVK
jgi:hypothetical protein